MVSQYSSSASLSSSSSYSRFSHTSSSSSLSTPSSSADSPSSQPFFHEGNTITGVASIVPFLWEEKPGVLKQEMEKKREERDEGHIGPSSHNPSSWKDGKDSSKVDFVASKKIPPPRDKIAPENYPPLRPPPSLLISPLPAGQALHHHHRKLNHNPVGQAMPSYSFQKRRHQRGSSLDDDPFWLAMVVCTNEGKGSANGGRDAAGRTDGGGLAKKIQEHSLHFDQCMPRRALSSTRPIKDEGKTRANRPHPTSSVEVGMDSSFSRSTNDKGSQAAYNSANNMGLIQRHGNVGKAIVKLEGKSVTARCVNDIGLAGKAVKPLSISKSGLYTPCKDLLQQQSSEDLSRGHAKKLLKIPDLFGCKSDRPFPR